MSAVRPSIVARAWWLLPRDVAAIYGMIGRLWMIMTGPVTILFLAIYFTPGAQGYFVTFITLAAARTVAELGLGQVIVVKVAQLHRQDGGQDFAVSPEVAGLVQFTAKWFAWAGLLVGVGLSLIGMALFSARSELPLGQWLPPWIALSALVGIDVALSGLLYPLEGAGQVTSVYFCRMVRSFVNTLILWLFILLGFELWSISIGLAASLLWATYFLYSKGKLVLTALRRNAHVARVDWLAEVFPAQWRIALSSTAEYVGFFTIVPLMYVMHGAIVAGQVGVTWQLTLAVSSIAGALVFARLPEFSRLAKTGSVRELDNLLLSTSLISMAVCLVGATGVAVGVLVLEKVDTQIASRLLPFDEVVIALIGVLIWHFNLTIVAYLRAHGGDPYLPASLTGATLLFVANVTLGQWFGPTGMLWGYVLTGICVMVPLSVYLLQRKRRACGYPPFRVEFGWRPRMSRSG
jgi:hypothetical protein